MHFQATPQPFTSHHSIRFDCVNFGLERLRSDYGKTILLVTHDPRAAERAGTLLHLEKGALVEAVKKYEV